VKGDYDGAMYFDGALVAKMHWQFATWSSGKDHPDTVTNYENIALVLNEMDDFDGALEHLEKSLTPRFKQKNNGGSMKLRPSIKNALSLLLG
jgi:hypothetical protein